MRYPTVPAALLALAATLAISGCSATTPAKPVAESTAVAASPDTAASGPAPMSSDAYSDAFAEREQFFADQQQPRDGSLLSVKTPAQQQFVAEQRAWIESQGGQWSAQTESVLLATVLDACETSILNGHDIDTASFQAHVSTSPLFAQVAGDDPAAERGLASIMVFGTEFVCPDDGAQWRAAFEELYPS